MATNLFFNNYGASQEQTLYEDLIIEAIKVYGVDVYYIPRTVVNTDNVFKDPEYSTYGTAISVEMYIKNVDGFEGDGSFLSKFGIQALNEISITISRERFETYISPLIADIPDIKLSSRPKEGDLIYFPLGDRLFEIKFVEHEKPFYQLRKNYTYTLKCDLS